MAFFFCPNPQAFAFLSIMVYYGITSLWKEREGVKARAYTRRRIKTEGTIIQILSVIAVLWELLMLWDNVTTLHVIALVCAICLFFLGARYRKMARESKNDTIYLKNWNKTQQ